MRCISFAFYFNVRFYYKYLQYKKLLKLSFLKVGYYFNLQIDSEFDCRLVWKWTEIVWNLNLQKMTAVMLISDSCLNGDVKSMNSFLLSNLYLLRKVLTTVTVILNIFEALQKMWTGLSFQYDSYSFWISCLSCLTISK